MFKIKQKIKINVEKNQTGFVLRLSELNVMRLLVNLFLFTTHNYKFVPYNDKIRFQQDQSQNMSSKKNLCSDFFKSRFLLFFIFLIQSNVPKDKNESLQIA